MTESPALIVDVDGTLCPVKSGDARYEDLEPYDLIVQRLRQWQADGFRIVLYTSRNMRSFDGNIGLINKHTAPTLLDWLQRWSIPFDELHFGKPWPGHDGFYVDDRAVRPDEFLKYDADELRALLADARLEGRKNSVGQDMNIVVTMAGSGERFRRAGFDQPKFMIEAKGRSLFRWSMMSLKNFFPLCQRLIFIVRSEDQAGDSITSEMAEWSVPNPILVPLSHRTDGQATSALAACDVWDPDKALLIYNIDTHVEPEFLKPQMVAGSGWIPCFRADGAHWSFVRTDCTGRALEVREKQRISDFASVGLYWFETATLFEWAYAAHFEAGDEAGSAERYIAPLYNDLIRAGHEVTMSEIPAAAVVPLGTPEELDRFTGC